MTVDLTATGLELDAWANSDIGTTKSIDMQGGDIGTRGFDFDSSGFDSF